MAVFAKQNRAQPPSRVAEPERATKPASDAGRQRVVIENLLPEIDGGRFPAKGTVGESVIVEADIFADGHDMIAGRLLYRAVDSDWIEAPLQPLSNDHWRGEFLPTSTGAYEVAIVAWIDRFGTWRRDLERKSAAGQDVAVDLLTGAGLIDEFLAAANGENADRMKATAAELRSQAPIAHRLSAALSDEIAALMRRHDPRRFAVEYPRRLTVHIDRAKARYSTWYELFPRSCAKSPGTHGTLRDVIDRLPYIAKMGFDVLYLPPIHPIGRSHRKGPNNRTTAAQSDLGSPWAIGSVEDGGGHKAIHPQLGTLRDFDALAAEASKHGIEIALDLAYQCSPDHPNVREHPEWFRQRPDGTIQHAENPPKKYEDIVAFDFECENWRELWEELASVVEFWIKHGVRIFRVDNPHTKPLRFWEWLIDRIKRQNYDVLFLSEAFTRPRVMYHLAKVGFTQSYTYFTWRNAKAELERYFKELTSRPVRDFFRPNLWPNTPDILNEYLQHGGRPAFMCRTALAATLAGNYGIYGPAFELCEHQPRESGSEEYLDSEKYQLREWDLDAPHSLAPYITRLNQIRRQNAALQSDRNLYFHRTSHEDVICHSKRTDDRTNVIICIVNLNPNEVRTGWVDLDLKELGLDAPETSTFQVHDLLGGGRMMWSSAFGVRNGFTLDPNVSPAQVLLVRQRVRTERDFDYYL